MTDPKVYTELSLTQNETTGYEGLHAGYNDGMILDVDGASLVGAPPGERGPAKKIVLVAPLIITEESQLEFNFDLEALQEQVDALGASHTADVTALAGLVSAESDTRAGADNALGARLDAFESDRPPAVLIGANLAGLGTPTGLPVNRTCLGFARDTNKLYVWDPDSTWIILN